MPDSESTSSQDGVPESAVLERLRSFQRFRWVKNNAQYPYRLRGVDGLPLSPPKTNNCVTFVEALVIGAWQDTHRTFSWSKAQHDQMMIKDAAADPFSSITVMLDAGIAVDDVDPEKPPPWTVMQGWKAGYAEGHILIIVARHESTDRVLTLESTRARPLNGVGFRGFHNLKDVDDGPPFRWWDSTKAPKWSRICALFPARRLARLKIVPGSWCVTG